MSISQRSVTLSRTRFPKTSRGSLHFNSYDQNDFLIGRLKTKCQHQQHIFPNSTSEISQGTHPELNDVSDSESIYVSTTDKVGGSLAYLQTCLFSGRRYFALLASSVLIFTWLNLSNDVYDFDAGADKNKKESVLNLVGSRSGPVIAAYLSLVSASLGWLGHLLMHAVFVHWPYLLVLYHVVMYISEIIFLPLTRTVFSTSLLVGLTTTLILFCSHFHQVEEDIAVGKISPLVKIGTERGSVVVKGVVLTLYSLLFALGLPGVLPLTCIVLCALTLPIGKLVVNFVDENYKDKRKIFMVKYYCVRLHALFGAAMTTGLVSARALLK